MSVRRVMGIETEYGISVPGQPGANAMVTSSQVVNAYHSATAAKARRTRWDFEEENPLRDARGFDLSRDTADASQLTDEDLGLANVILTNGARLYVDHAHPEYSAPETPIGPARPWLSRPHRRPRVGGLCPGWPRTRCRPPASWTGWPSWSCWRATGTGTGWAGATRGCSWSTCSTPTCAPSGACTTGWWRGGGCSGSCRRPRSPGRWKTRRMTPGPTSAAAAC